MKPFPVIYFIYDKDEHGFETGKAGSPLSSFYVMPAKITEEIIIVSAP